MSELTRDISGLHGKLRREVFGKVNQLHKSLRAEIRDGVTDSVCLIYPYLSGVQPIETCWQSDDGVIGYLLSYPKHIKSNDHSLFVSCDEQGRIQRILTPK